MLCKREEKAEGGGVRMSEVGRRQETFIREVLEEEEVGKGRKTWRKR